MLKVGLTGNVAAGKSTVARAWRALGATVVDADELARRAVEPGSQGLAAVRARWGDAVLDAGGSLDRAALRAIVFADPAERAALERIVHPEVARLRDAAFAEAEARGERVVVADVPLLFEAGLTEEVDRVVLVDAPEEVRLERMVRDRGLDPAEARAIVDAQMPAVLKRARADHLIVNDGTLDDVERRAREVWEELSREAEAAGG